MDGRLFLIDIAVPRDIAADAGKLPGVFLYDLDDVKKVAEANLRERKQEAAAAERLIDEEVREFLEWRRSLDVVPLLVELRRRADEIRKAEIEKATQAASARSRRNRNAPSTPPPPPSSTSCSTGRPCS